MARFRRFGDQGFVAALTVFPVAFALFVVTAAPAWAQRTYDRLPIVKEGATIRISPRVYVIPDESARADSKERSPNGTVSRNTEKP